ncbi:MAG TPA: glycosyltransferase family 4 protein [Candidatus Paceibacterota bacterium]
MKLVIATPLYPPEIGGPATYARALEEGLSKQGIEVELVKFSEVRHLPKLVRHIAYFARVRRALRRADAVLALDPVSTGLPACLAAWVCRKPLVVKIVGDYAWEQGRQRAGVTATLDEFVATKRVSFLVWFLRRVQTGVAKRARLIIVPSEYLKGIVAAWGIPREKISVVYNAVPLEEAGKVPEEVAALPRPLVVTAGRLVPWKRVDGVIDAVAALRAQGVSASLAVVGEGPERARLTARASDALGSACVFTGTLPHADTLAVLAAADAFVLNSSYEGLSHLLIEALALGVPTIATRVGGNPEVLTDGEEGLLIPAGDTAALTAALARVLADELLRARLSARAQASVERFSLATMLAETARVFSEEVRLKG